MCNDITMMQIEHYVSLHWPPLLHLLFYNSEHIDHEIPPRILFLSYILYHWFEHVHQLTKIMKKITSHDDFPTFINFIIEILQNAPSIFQSPKNILNEHMTMIHWIITPHLISVTSTKTTKSTWFIKPKQK